MSRTIFALASAQGKAGIAVLRVAGPQALSILRALTGKQHWTPGFLCRVFFTEPQTGIPMDDGMAVYFPAGRSYTGDEAVEIHCHGSVAVIRRFYALLATMPETTLAEPGEFTKRRLLNGKTTLLELEGLADLLEAETETQHALALRYYRGEASALYEKIREQLLTIRAHIEACLDFADEELPPAVFDGARRDIHALIQEAEGLLADSARGEELRNGIPVAIVGPPNVGKSTLLNAIAQREIAITSPYAGTTRDVLEVALNLGGYAVVLADTAGIRDTDHPLEQIGIARAQQWREKARLVVVVVDDETLGVLPQYWEAEAASRVCVVYNKQDKGYALPADLPPGIWVAAEKGQGVAALVQWLSEALRSCYADMPTLVLTHERHRQCLEGMVRELRAALGQEQEELLAEHLRLADTWLGKLTGRVDVEEILGTIFSRFCIGK